jgi:hypothetical protein
MNQRFRFGLAALTALTLLLSGLPDAMARGGNSGGGDDDGGNGGGGKALTLRINEAIGAPGGVVAIVLRTYAPRPIRQGQVVVRVRRRPPASKQLALTAEALTAKAITQPVRPFMTLVSATVYSVRGDSVSQSTLAGQADSQTATVRFTSASSTINASDGPLAVFKFKLDPSVVPGQTFDVSIDPASTGLVDPNGQPIAIEPRDDGLTIRAPQAPFQIEAEGDEVRPGEAAELGVQTFEPFPVSGGRVTLRYAPRLAGGPPTVKIDPRYGKATFTVDRSKPGVLVVDFKSPDSSLNTVPGTIVAVSLPVIASARVGDSSAVTLDPAGTWLLTKKGRKVSLKIENGRLDVR